MPDVLDVEPRTADRRLLLVLAVGVLVVALVLGGLAVVDRLRGGASSPVALADRVVAALDDEDLPALGRLVEPDERRALLRLATSLQGRLADLDLPPAVVGAAPDGEGDPSDGLDLDVRGAAPTVVARAGDVAVVDLGGVSVRLRGDPGVARGLLRAWFAYRHVSVPQDQSLTGDRLPAPGALPRLVAVERSGRWYLSPLGTLLGPDVAGGSLPDVEAVTPLPAPDPRTAVEATLRTLLDGGVQSDVSGLAGTLDGSGADLLQLWASEVATTGLDRSPVTVTALRTTAGPVDGDRAVVRVEQLRVGDGSAVDLAGRCLTTYGTRSCLRPSGYRYVGGIGSLGALELLGRDGAFTVTAVRRGDGWVTSLPESLADAAIGYADGLTREQALMVLGDERLDTPSGVLDPGRAEDVAFTSGGYALRTVRVAEAGLYRVVPGPAGANRSALYGPDGQPSLQPFFPNDSVYRLTPGDHTLLVWADDGFTRTLRQPGAAPYVQRVEVRAVR